MTKHLRVEPHSAMHHIIARNTFSPREEALIERQEPERNITLYGD